MVNGEWYEREREGEGIVFFCGGGGNGLAVCVCVVEVRTVELFKEVAWDKGEEGIL